MGCDIHCYVEKRTPTGDWVMEHDFRSDWYEEGHSYFGADEFKSGADAPIDQRNYALFGFLAGVRSDVTPALHWLGERRGDDPFSPWARGTPPDCSAAMKEIMDDVDYHSHSWLTLGELRTAWHAAQFSGEGDEFDLTDCIQQLEQRGGDDEIRIVFAFDN